MLRCAGNRIYTGYAVDAEARFQQHLAGKGARFTKAFPPECILKTFELQSKEYALRLEARIKKLKRPEKEHLASGDKALEAVLMGSLDQVLKPRRKRKKSAAKSKVSKNTEP